MYRFTYVQTILTLVERMKFVFTKIKKRVKRELKNIISYNASYRPTGIYATSKNFVQAQLEKGTRLFYQEIYTNLVSNLTIDKDLYDASPDYFKPHLTVQTTYLVVEVPNGRVHTDNAASIAIISEDNKMLGDVSFSYNYGRTVQPSQNSIFKQKFFRAPKKVDGVVFTLISGGAALNNYSHWLLDALPRIHLLKESGMFDKVDWFLVPAYKYDYQKQTLSLLGIGPEKIIAGDLHPHIQADTILASTAPRGNDSIIPFWLCDFLRNSFMKEERLKASYPPHIYLSRKDSAVRIVANEAKLEGLLERYNFKTFVLSELSFIEKVHLFANAQVILSATGAGMTNMVFCRKGTKIIELFNEGFVVGPFYDLADKVDLEYHYMICKTGSKAKTLKQGQEEDLVVDLTQVETLLDKLLDITIKQAM